MRLAVRSSLVAKQTRAWLRPRDRIVETVRFLDLIERLGDQEARQLM
jgi:hypothetical protein